MSARGWIGWTTLTLAIAAVVHIASIHFLPHMVMNRAMAQMGAVNTIHHGARATAEIHGVVRPSPDLLYSVCPFDLSKAPLRVTAPVPPGTYWSVSMFDDKTNNFFVLNDRQAKDGKVDLLVYGPGQMFVSSYLPPEHPPPWKYVSSPSARGLVLFRTLVDNEKDITALEAARRKAKCWLSADRTFPFPSSLSGR
jgi:uncharacterized membrane protein